MKRSFDVLGRSAFAGFLMSVMVFCTAEATSYYVKVGGNDNNSGLSDSLAWATMNKVNGFTFQTSDSVFFKCGGTWQNKALYMRWSGAAGHQAVIGAYYVNASKKEVIGVQGEKPILAGTPYLAANPYPPKVASTSGDSGSWAGMVGNAWNYTPNYVTVENLHITHSAGQGIVFGASTGMIIRNNEVDTVHRAGITADGNTHCLYENNVVHETDRQFIENPGHGWPSAVGMNDNNNGNVIRGNTIYENYGEGIGIYFAGGSNDTIENNTLFDNRAAGIDIDNEGGTGIIIRNNLFYNTNNTQYWRGGGLPTAALYLADQGTAPIGCTRVYNNFIAHFSAAMTFGCVRTSWGSSTCTSIPQDSLFIYNNTVAGVSNKIIAWWTSNFSHCEMRNNIFWLPDSGDYATGAAPGNWTFSNNLWFGGKTNSAVGSNDVLANPLLTKTTGWSAPTAFGLTANDFKIQSASPAKDHGVAVGMFNTDFFGTSRPQGSAWDIGAYEYSATTEATAKSLKQATAENAVTVAGRTLSISTSRVGTVKIYNAIGICISALQARAGQPVSVKIGTPGVYFVKIGDVSVGRVVVR